MADEVCISREDAGDVVRALQGEIERMEKIERDYTSGKKTVRNLPVKAMAEFGEPVLKERVAKLRTLRDRLRGDPGGSSAAPRINR